MIVYLLRELEWRRKAANRRRTLRVLFWQQARSLDMYDLSFLVLLFLV